MATTTEMSESYCWLLNTCHNYVQGFNYTSLMNPLSSAAQSCLKFNSPLPRIDDFAQIDVVNNLIIEHCEPPATTPMATSTSMPTSTPPCTDYLCIGVIVVIILSFMIFLIILFMWYRRRRQTGKDGTDRKDISNTKIAKDSYLPNVTTTRRKYKLHFFKFGNTKEIPDRGPSAQNNPVYESSIEAPPLELADTEMSSCTNATENETKQPDNTQAGEVSPSEVQVKLEVPD